MTKKWWEEQHLEWQTCTEKVLETIKQLPQDRLKNGLGKEYDGVMNLKMVMIMNDADIADAVRSDKECKGYSELAPSVSQKRTREDLQKAA